MRNAEVIRQWQILKDIEASRTRCSVNPFDADRKRMSIFRADRVLYAKGGIESIASTARLIPEGALEAASEMASRGLRVLAVAVGTQNAEVELELVGLLVEFVGAAECIRHGPDLRAERGIVFLR